MKKLGLLALAAAMTFAFAPQAGAQVAFDGKVNTCHASPLGGLPLFGPGAIPHLGGVIAKGKKKTLIKCEATVTSGLLAPFAPWTISMGIDANGIPLLPGTTFPDSVVQDCGSDSFAGPFASLAEGCTAHGHFMLDVDANPALIGVPVFITLHAGTGGNAGIVGIPADASLCCRMQKKK